MKKLSIFLIAVLGSNLAHAECVPARTEVPWPDDFEGSGAYYRVHPSGNYMLASSATDGSSSVGIVDLTRKDADGNPKGISTPMNAETYCVEGTWRICASPNHPDGMRYYSFKDTLKKGKGTTPVFNDKDFNQYYHSAAELPGSTEENVKFRTLLWRDKKFRDYEIRYDKDGGVKSYVTTQTKIVCHNFTQGSYSSPILSKDGTEVAFLNGSQRIFKIKEDASCEEVDNLNYSTSKVNFSYPDSKPRALTFTADTNVVVNGQPKTVSGVLYYDRETKQTIRLSKDKESTGYPGFTKDGRVMYVDTGRRMIVTVDPGQFNPDGTESADKSRCIQKEVTGTQTPPARPAQSNQQ